MPGFSLSGPARKNTKEELKQPITTVVQGLNMCHVKGGKKTHKSLIQALFEAGIDIDTGTETPSILPPLQLKLA